jgi:hypothetical protein
MTMEMTTPTDAYCSWYEQQDQEIQTDISHMIVYMWPEHPLESHLHAHDLNSRFSLWIKNDSDNQFKTVGKILALIKLTEFVFINQRGTHEDWDITWKRMEDMLKAAQDEGQNDIAETFQNIMEDLPVRSHKWILAAGAWQKIRISNMSDDALHSYLSRRRPA